MTNAFASITLAALTVAAAWSTALPTAAADAPHRALIAQAHHDAGRAPAHPRGAARACVRGGCNGEICEEEGVGTVSTCEARSDAACYASARCERQRNGQCGFTETPQLRQCLANVQRAPSADAPQ